MSNGEVCVGVLVDEYQDLNRAEQELIDLLSADRSLAVVGDDDDQP